MKAKNWPSLREGLRSTYVSQTHTLNARSPLRMLTDVTLYVLYMWKIAVTLELHILNLNPQRALILNDIHVWAFYRAEWQISPEQTDRHTHVPTTVTLLRMRRGLMRDMKCSA